MPESQLKRLKASLRTAGITRQQKSKKSAKKSATKNDSRLDRNVALQSIREEFNPFEVKTNRVKHNVLGRGVVKGAQGRPGLSKQIGEENRKRTLLVEMQRRNKVGGIVDRRFGENDPTMTPEERMLERFTKEKQKRVRGGDIFNLDDDSELTHFGQSLGGLLDDFDAENDLTLPEDDDEPSRKRPLAAEGSDVGSDEEGRPARKKSKAEVMKEVITKSKLHKYERQKAKEDDEEEREKLDTQMGDIWALLGSRQPSTTGGPGTGANSEPVPGRDEAGVEKPQVDGNINPERLAKMNDTEYDYDAAVREMIFDKRSKPSERTKTEEEKAQEESERLRKLEEARQKRMRGEEESEDESAVPRGGDDDDTEFGDAAAYGLGAGIPEMPVQGHDNPDELVDGDYEISEDGYMEAGGGGSINASDAEFPDDPDSDYSEPGSEEEDDGFLDDVLPRNGERRGGNETALGLSKLESKDERLAFTFPCPQTHKEMLEIVKGVPVEDLPTVVQRIRVLYHPKLHADNKPKLAQFSAVLLEHVLHVSNEHSSSLPFHTIETLIRHLHALTKSHPEEASAAFRTQLTSLHEKRSTTDMTAADLILLTSISTIFPTSDHFHQVTTPAMIVICKWLSQTFPTTLARLVTGTYLVTLCMQYVRLPKRYIPEAINFVLQALSLLAPFKQSPTPGTFPVHEPDTPLRIASLPPTQLWTPRKLAFTDIFGASGEAGVKLAVVHTLLDLLERMADAWTGKTAFVQVFEPAFAVVTHLMSKRCARAFPEALKITLKQTEKTLTTYLQKAQVAAAPLLLHYHRPLPIKTHAPRFEEAYSLDRHSRDADVKLKAEYKRERKGAIRELRKDSRFVAREKLKEDKKASAEYHEKMRRLTAMIQTEEGAAANEYKRAKAKK